MRYPTYGEIKAFYKGCEYSESEAIKACEVVVCIQDGAKQKEGKLWT